MPVMCVGLNVREPGLTLRDGVSQLRELEAAVAHQFHSTIQELEATSTRKTSEVGVGYTSALPEMEGIVSAVQQGVQDFYRIAKGMKGGPPAPKAGLYRHGLDEQCRQLREEVHQLKKEQSVYAEVRQDRRELRKEVEQLRGQLRVAQAARARPLGPGEVRTTVQRERVAGVVTGLEAATKEVNSLLATFSFVQ